MKIYTKKGDKGYTYLLGCERVSKDNIQVKAYGTLDELNSYIGLLRACITNKNITNFLLKIQKNLFTIQTITARSHKKEIKNIPEIKDEDITELEMEIDRYEESIEKLTHFIIPGGNQVISFTHIARTVCRRAEREMVGIKKYIKKDELFEYSIKYINRLSDYLFTLARLLSKIYNIKEIYWTPNNKK